MAYNQIYSIVNEATKQALGARALAANDSSTLVDVGGQIITGGSATISAFMNGLMSVINKTRIKAKSYQGSEKVSAYRTPEEYGLYMRKIQSDNVQDSVENTSYMAQDANAYDGSLTTNWTDRLFGLCAGFETSPTIVQRKQLEKCFKDPEEMAAFITMLDTSRMNDIKCHMESTELLARGTAIFSCFSDAKTVVDLNAIYSAATGDTSVTPVNWRYNADFVRFCAVEIPRISKRLLGMNRVYNNANCDRFTDESELVLDIHTDFVSALNGYVNNTLIEKFMKLPLFNEVTRWQASGITATFDDAEGLYLAHNDITIAESLSSDYGWNNDHGVHIEHGLIAFAHDIEKYATTISDLRTVTGDNPLQETTTTVTKFDTAWAVDPSEQGVVFIVGV